MYFEKWIFKRKNNFIYVYEGLVTLHRCHGKCSARTKQGYLWIEDRIKSSDTEMKRLETQSKVVAFNMLDNSTECESGEQ